MTSALRAAGRALAIIDRSAPGAERIAARVSNIKLLCEAVHREIILLGKELSDCKWSGDYLLDPLWDQPEHNGKSRTWDIWLKKVQCFVLRTGKEEVYIDDTNAANLMAFSACFATLAAENRKREAQGILPLPLPNTHAQIGPFQKLFDRVEDWSAEDEWPEDVKAIAPDNAIRDTQPPYAEEQPSFLAKWADICDTLPVDKRQTKDGLMAPPPRDFSRNYLKREAEIARKEKEAAEAKDKPAAESSDSMAITVGKKKQSSETASSGATAKQPKAPQKSQEEKEAEVHEAALRKDIMDYRNGLHNLRTSADALEARLKNILVKNGDGRLAEMRKRTDLGVYSVDNDLELLRGAVETCQRVFRLATEPYTPPTPISRAEVAADAVVDVTQAVTS